MTKKFLNVGAGDRSTPVPGMYAGFEHLLLDIDPKFSPDILCDARQLTTLAAGQFDAIYCSHNLEHYYRHDVPKVLAGFLHVLKPDGFAHIRVPDLDGLMRAVVSQGLDVENVIYTSAAGPITVLDVIYGYGVEIERSGQDFYAHKTGFTAKSLTATLQRAGFGSVYQMVRNLEIEVLAFRQMPEPAVRQWLGLPEG